MKPAPTTTDSILTPDELEALGHKILGMTTADTVTIDLTHTARGTAVVAQNRIRPNDDGDAIHLGITTQFGQRAAAALTWDRIDDDSLRAAVTYLEQLARNQPGDPIRLPIPERARHYLPGTVWYDSTMDALAGARNAILPSMITAMVKANLKASIFVGVMARARLAMSKSGLHVSGHETDAEIIVSGWTPSGTGMGWAGQANRDWTKLQPEAVVAEAIRLTEMDDHPVAVEPGRRTVILGAPAVAQFAALMAYAWDAYQTIENKATPFWDAAAHTTRLTKRVLDERINIAVDPNDPEGGYLPFDGTMPLVPMHFVEHGVLTHLAFGPLMSTRYGVSPLNGNPVSMRVFGDGPVKTVEEMIASCDQGIYVNRVADLQLMDGTTGAMSGVTHGGCFFIEHGKITKPVKDLRFVDSPFLFLNNLIAIGAPARTAFGYSPWAGEWPIAPSIVPPVMVKDFNFTRLSDAA